MCICTVIRKYVTGGHVPSGPYRVYLAKEILGRILPCCCFTMKILRITNNIAAVNFPYYTLHCQHNISWRLQNLQKDYWDLDFLKISNKVSLFEEKKSLSWPRPGASGRAVWVRLWKGETSVGTCSIRENCQKESPPIFEACVSSNLWTDPRQIMLLEMLTRSWDFEIFPPPVWNKIPTFSTDPWVKFPSNLGW